MSAWQAVVFDLDDTLYLERDYVFSGFRAVARWAERTLSVPATLGYRELVQLFDAGVRGHTFDVWLGQHHADAARYVEAMVEVYRAHTPDIAPFPEVPALLKRLGRVYKLGLVSDGYLDVQRKKFTALNLAAYFDAVVFSDLWGRAAWKPSRKPFLAVLEGLGRVLPQNAVYVADNPLKDFLGPRQLGMGAIRVRYPAGLHCDAVPPSQMYASAATIPSLLDLEDALASTEGGHNL